jgi:hypothetical protein
LTHDFYYSKSKSSYMFRMHKAAIIILYMSENCNYTAVAMPIIIKSMAKISPLHKAYVNVTSGKHFYNM